MAKIPHKKLKSLENFKSHSILLKPLFGHSNDEKGASYYRYIHLSIILTAIAFSMYTLKIAQLILTDLTKV